MRILMLFLLALLFGHVGFAQPFTDREIGDWKKRAQRVTITRDQWGIPHVHGETDPDAVFGFLYAQCEDDFKRVEMNYIIALGRTAEVEGEGRLYHDLRQRMLYDSAQAVEWYEQAPGWLKKLCDAFAAGTNFYLQTHPQVKPRLITRFQPWMPFLFSEGSIGGDIEAISVTSLKNFYEPKKSPTTEPVPDLDGGLPEPSGSNGFAIAPQRSASGHALFMINPHTSFYFRPEVHVRSDEGLNAYGASTWGQFFVYQGFNESCGWMHTSSQADCMDEYLETVSKTGNGWVSRFGSESKKITSKQIRLKYKSGDRKLTKEFTAYYTIHGPVVRKEGEKWVAMAMMKEPVKALQQSFLRTKAKGLDEFQKVMDLKTNSSNNTVFADNKGNIAYWHGNYIPRRNPRYDWSKPVDGSDPETSWKGLHEVKEIVQIVNPATGWIQNCNSTPFTVSGSSSPKPDGYPIYMAPDQENPRGLNAARVLPRFRSMNLNQLIEAAYDPHLTAFDQLIPTLIKAFDEWRGADEKKMQLALPIDTLRAWNRNWSVGSVATTLAVYWGQDVRAKALKKAKTANGILPLIHYICDSLSNEEKLASLEMALSELTHDHGTWVKGWGEVNRFQRLTGQIDETYDDSMPSLAVPFTSSFWGSLASFGAKKYPGTVKMYGNGGNSFVAAVEFGPRIRAKSVLAGGNGGDPSMASFGNQSELYANGRFKDVLYYAEDIDRHAVRKYRPGDSDR